MTHAEIFPADLSEARSAGAAARGVDTIVYCVGLPYPSHHLHPVLMRTTVEAAKLVRVERLVLPSSVYSYGVPRTSRVAETHPREPHTRKGKYRKEQEDIVMEAHAAGALQGMIVRLPDFYGPDADIGLANPMFRAALAGKTANWVGPVNHAARVCVRARYRPGDRGPGVAAGMFRRGVEFRRSGAPSTRWTSSRASIAAWGAAPKYRTVGAGMLKFLGWFNPTMREVVEMLYLQETPVILDDSKLMAKLPVHKTPYDDGIRQTLDWMRGK